MQILIHRKPILLNHARIMVKRGKKIFPTKTIEAKLFEREVKDAVKVAKKIQSFKLEEFKDKTLKVSYDIGLKDFYTKKFTINKKSGDIDNYIKILQDAIFKELGLDDSFIIEIVARKYPSLSYYTSIRIDLCNLTIKL